MSFTLCKNEKISYDGALATTLLSPVYLHLPAVLLKSTLYLLSPPGPSEKSLCDEKISTNFSINLSLIIEFSSCCLFSILVISSNTCALVNP